MKHILQRRIVLIGTGNVAWHLGHVLVRKGVTISQVLGRTRGSVRQLANELKAKDSGEPEELDRDADACLICISDDAIQPVLEKLKPGNCLLIHTAGSVSMDVFTGHASRYGVLYPLQTLTKNRPVDFQNIPLLIEANMPENLDLIRSIAGQISGRIIQADSNQRSFMHLAAVFAGNFTNHMFSIAEELVLEKGLPFEWLNPLMKEITAKALAVSPRLAQTGPALRGNKVVMEKHLALLDEHPGWQEIYRLLSKSIKVLHT